MKKILSSILFVMVICASVQAQTLNWRSLKEQPNAVYTNIGYDYGVTTQFGFARVVHVVRPVVVSLDYSMPMGHNLIDDFKIRTGGRVEIIEKHAFSLSANILANARRYQTGLARIFSFGAEITAVAGFFTPTFHVAAELGRDKSIVSHLKHSGIMKQNYPEIHDGWYMTTGGHTYYGMQGSKSIGQSFDVSLRLGMTSAQGKSDVLPVYFQIGLMKKM